MHKRCWSSRNSKRAICKSAPRGRNQFPSALAILKFLVPGHLNRFQLGFIGFLRIAGETGELGDPFVHVREADGERISIRKFVVQRDGDVFDLSLIHI